MNSHRIDNSSRFTSIADDVDIAGGLGVSGDITVNRGTTSEFKLPNTLGVAGQTPVLNSSGRLEWGTPGTGISNQITNLDGTSHITSVAAGTSDNVDITCDGVLSAKFLPDLLELYSQGTAPTVRFRHLDNLQYVGIRAPATGALSYDITLPSAPPARSMQVLAATADGTASWTDTALAGGNALGDALNIGTRDAFPLNLCTNGTARFTIDVSGNISGSGSSWTQNRVAMVFSTAPGPKNTNTASALTSFTVPGGYTQMRVQLWAGGGSYKGGSGAYAEVTLNVTSGQTYWVLTGAPGQGKVGGVAANSTNFCSGADGNSGGDGGAGGQASALVRQAGGTYILIAVAGGGGGGTRTGGGGGGGGTGATGGTGTGSGGDIVANATTTGYTSLQFGGAGGTSGSFNRAGGGGGYGGGDQGGDGGGGGGTLIPAPGTVISSAVVVSSNSIDGNSGGSAAAAANTADANYQAGYSVGGSPTGNGGPGLTVVTLTQSSMSSTSSIKTAGQFQMARLDGTQTAGLKASDTSTSWVMTLPPSSGTADYVLTTNGSGVTNWSPAVPATYESAIAMGSDAITATVTSSDYVKVSSGAGGITLASTNKYRKVTIKNITGSPVTVYSADASAVTTVAPSSTSILLAAGLNTWVDF